MPAQADIHAADRDGFDEAAARAALAEADPNVLRMVLLQLTGDPALERMRVEKKPIRAGVLMLSVLAPEHHEEVRERMLDYLRSRPVELPPLPSAGEQRRLMELFSARAMSDVEARYGIEELALDDDPRRVEWSAPPPPETVAAFQVCIIGAGISGLAAAVQLKRLGIPFRIIDRLDRIGGTWARNEYPGVGVDVNAFLYQFKFEKRYPWRRFFPQGAEIRQYLEHIAEKYGVREHIDLSTEVISARWDEDAAKWRIDIRDRSGRGETLEANVLVSASGLFNAIKLPDIEGIGDFAGPVFHTAAWEQGFDPAGKRIALIGNGSSGTQVMPLLAESASHLTVYQRTAQWISEMENYKTAVSPQLAWVIGNVPYYWNWMCYATFSASAQLQTLQEFDRDWQATGGMISQANDRLRGVLTGYIEQKLQSPELIAKTMPRFAPLARRPVVDNGWYDALLRDNVELVVDWIERIAPQGIRTADGVERQFDAIVLGTGFEVSRYMWPVRYQGRGGVTLEQQWNADGARAYLGMVMPNFPNLFIFYGPNGQPRAGGFYSWAEIWARYVTKAIVGMIEGGQRAIEVKSTVFEEYNRAMDVATRELIWETEGTGGYYVNEKGRSGVNMPWRVEHYYEMVEAPNPEDFDFR